MLPLIGLFMPFAVFWMRAHFVNMPGELSEAARVDGASTWDLFWRIHVPLARAPIVSLGILMSIWAWNQFLLALVLVEDPTQRTMAGALGAFQGHYATDIPLLCAGTILILLPTLVLFILFQRHIITALLQGSVKGCGPGTRMPRIELADGRRPWFRRAGYGGDRAGRGVREVATKLRSCASGSRTLATRWADMAMPEPGN